MPVKITFRDGFNEDVSTVVLSPFSGRVTKLIGRIGGLGNSILS